MLSFHIYAFVMLLATIISAWIGYRRYKKPAPRWLFFYGMSTAFAISGVLAMLFAWAVGALFSAMMMSF